MRLRALLAVALVTLVVIGCEQIIGANFGVTTETCTHIKPPPPPADAAPGGQDFLVAATSLNFGDLPDGGFDDTLGYDLDGLCTFHGQGPPCSLAAWTDAGVVHDGQNGQDNGIGRFVAYQSQIVGVQSLSTATLTAAIAADTNAPPVMLHITGYNGFPTSAVSVEWLLPAVNTSDAGSRWQTPDAGTLPVFDYVNRWTADTAYVTDSRLVAHFTNGPAIRIANIPLTTADVTVVADVVKNALPNGADLVGWATMQTMFATLPNFTALINGVPACTNNPAYPGVKSIYCSIADMLQDGGTSPSALCDAISFAVHVNVATVTAGNQVTETLPSLCAPGTDPGTDTCETP